MERANTLQKSDNQPDLGWRSILSMAPIAALLGFGTYLVFQEHRLARQEALESLNTAGADLLQHLENNVFLTRWIQNSKGFMVLNRHFLPEDVYSITIGPNGECLTPTSPKQAPIPSPRILPWELLSESLTLLWHQANQSTNLSNRLRLAESFITAQPPEPFNGLMKLTRINTRLDSNEIEAALAEIQKLHRSLPDNAHSESGLPLAVLLDFQELRAINELIAQNEDPDTAYSRFYSRALIHPNPWTRQMLTHHLPSFDSASKCSLLTQKLLDELDRRDEAHSIHASLPRSEWKQWFDQTAATPHWLNHQTDRVLVYRLTNQGTDREFIAASAASLKQDFQQALDRWRQQTPQANRFNSSIALAGRQIITPSQAAPMATIKNDPSESLQSIQVSEAYPWLQTRTTLANPDTFFSQSRKRTHSLLLLISLASVSGLVGWFAQRAAYRRQVALGRMKSNFVASVSHELRAPIASIRLMSENLQSNTPTNQKHRNNYLKWIGLECRRLTTLVENVLQFARNETKNSNATFEPVDVGKLYEETVHLMEPIANNAEVRLVIRPPLSETTEAPQSLDAIWDGQAVHQALINLIDNAVKHTPHKGIVSTKLELLRDQKAVEFVVIDQGPGIAPADRERIFSAFERLGSEATRHTKGVGIGLSLVRHTAHAHGGSISVKQADSGGSCFVLHLPLNQNQT